MHHRDPLRLPGAHVRSSGCAPVIALALLMLGLALAWATALRAEAQPAAPQLHAAGSALGYVSATPSTVTYQIGSEPARTVSRDLLEVLPRRAAYQHTDNDLALLLDALTWEGQAPAWPAMMDDSLAAALDSLSLAAAAAVAEIDSLREQLLVCEAGAGDVEELQAQVAALQAALAEERAAHAHTRSATIAQLRAVIASLFSSAGIEI